MLRFVDTEQEFPAERAARQRIQDFKEIYPTFTPVDAAAQSSRCSQCGIPFCQIHCPLQNKIPDWLRLTAEGRLREAYAISSATNSFPEICGRICPQDRLCEGKCVIEKSFGAVTIGAVEKYLTETAFAEDWVTPAKPACETGKSIGIIGAGPAGLAAADMLRRSGHEVHVYDRQDRVGGLLVYGIPNFKLDKSVVARREELLRKSGVQFHLNHRIGTDITFAGLREKHDAVLIATGVYKPRSLNIKGAKKTIPALDYLIASNREGLDEGRSTLHAEGKRVIVIGGGDTAMECVRTAIRQGAASVTCLYRRDRANMPGSRQEVKNAEQEGVHFEWLSAPSSIHGTRQIEAVELQRMRLTPADSTGRQNMLPIPGDTLLLQADMVITALGFEPEELPVMFATPELTCTASGTIAVDSRYQTVLPGVYAAGDIVRGASLVVWAIKDGRDAAAAIHASLLAQLEKAA